MHTFSYVRSMHSSCVIVVAGSVQYCGVRPRTLSTKASSWYRYLRVRDIIGASERRRCSRRNTVYSRRPPGLPAPVRVFVHPLCARASFARFDLDPVVRAREGVVVVFDLTTLELDDDTQLGHTWDEAERTPAGHREVNIRLGCP